VSPLVRPRIGHEGLEGEKRYSSTLSLTSALDGVGGQRHALATYSRERPRTHCTGGLVGPRAGLEGLGKSRHPPGFDPRTVQPVAIRYTDCAVPPRNVSSTPVNERALSQNVTANFLKGERTFSTYEMHLWRFFIFYCPTCTTDPTAVCVFDMVLSNLYHSSNSCVCF
jgi:hypothetical protein